MCLLLDLDERLRLSYENFLANEYFIFIDYVMLCFEVVEFMQTKQNTPNFFTLRF